MDKIMLNSESADALRNCTQLAALCDPRGNVIGFFEPPPRLYQPGEIPEFDEEELDRREARHWVMTSAEVRQGLGIPPRKIGDEL